MSGTGEYLTRPISGSSTFPQCFKSQRSVPGVPPSALGLLTYLFGVLPLYQLAGAHSQLGTQGRVAVETRLGGAGKPLQGAGRRSLSSEPRAAPATVTCQ
eukprot:3010146-Rhodomonas_salina.1